jgi:hypothetical protein
MNLLLFLSALLLFIEAGTAQGDDPREREEMRLESVRDLSRGDPRATTTTNGGHFETRQSFRAASITSDLEFYSLLIAMTALIFMKPWMSERLVMRYDCHTKSERRSRGWVHPPRLRHVNGLVMLADIFLEVAFIFFLWNARDPFTFTDQQYYVAIFALFFTIVILKNAWLYSTFNFFKHAIGIITGFVSVFILACVLISLFVVLIIRSWWLPFGFMVPVTLFYILAVIWNVTIARNHNWDRLREMMGLPVKYERY